MLNENLPDFAVIGAARSGTTAIHAYLRQCPEIFMPDVKEPNFFAYQDQDLAVTGPGADMINNSITRLADYQALFAAAPAGAIKGEASPLYLFEPAAPKNAAKLVPNLRIVVILRNPIEQAYSHYQYARKLAIEKEPNFKRALMKEGARIQRGWQPLFGYSQFPRYGTQLNRWFKYFPRDQFFIRTYEEFQENPIQTMKDMARFIGVKNDFVPDMNKRLNAGGQPRSTFVQNFLYKKNPITSAVGLVVPQQTRLAIRDWLGSFNTRADIAMSEDARDVLRERLAGEILETGRIIGRDMRYWMD